MLDAIALANTLALIDLILHPLIHIWIAFSPRSYERLMNLFVAGLNLKVNPSESRPSHIIIGTIIEAAVFWLIGAGFASLYNWFAM